LVHARHGFFPARLNEHSSRPENVLRAFIKTYPDLFPTSDLTHLGLIPDPEFGWPIGLSRTNVKHLGGLSAVGINCASCHVAQITSTSASEPIRILGATSHFDVEKFFGSILAATFKTSDAANMKKFLGIYLDADAKTFDAAWRRPEQDIIAIMKEDPFGAKGVPPSELHKIDNADVQQSLIDRAAARRGAPPFASNCNSCHGEPESDKRLYSVAEIGTDPHRAEMFTQKLADDFNRFLAELEAEGYQPPREVGVRSTGKYFAATLSGVWGAFAVLTQRLGPNDAGLLTPPQQRETRFQRGSRVFDEQAMGYTDEGAYAFDMSASGNSNFGHDYGTRLSPEEKCDLIEYLKTL
jgi:hypothetical protein